LGLDDRVKINPRKIPGIKVILGISNLNYFALTKKLMKDENIENCDTIISTLERVPKADTDATQLIKF